MAVKVFERGPYVQAALICEKVIEDNERVLTLVRIVDRITHSATGLAAPETMPTFSYPMSLVIMLKSGPARGTYPVRFDTESPSGARQQGPSFSVHLEGEDRGHNLVLNMNTTFTEQGLYWFDIYFDNDLITRIPLRVVYTRTIPSPTRPPQGPQLAK